jgi:hypothetical protein
MQRLRRAADLRGNRSHRRPPRGMILLVLENQPNRARAHFRRKSVRCLACHRSTFSRLGASGKPGAGQPRKPSPIRPVAPFSRNISEAAETAFDRETDKRVEPASLITYAEALAQYHLRPEVKFLNGDFFDRGRTERRHVVALQILHIGKEANKWEEQYFLGPDDEAEIEYGTDQTADDLDKHLRDLCRQLGEREASRKLGISRTALRRAMRLGAEAMSQRCAAA